MPKILILGGYGYTGRLLSRHLLQESGAEIILAGRHLEKARALCQHAQCRIQRGARLRPAPGCSLQ